MTKKIISILIIGIFIRLALAFSTYHSDTQQFYFAGEVIVKGNVVNFYDYLWSLPSNDPVFEIYPTYLFNYPPLVYFFLGPVSYLITLPFGREVMHTFVNDIPTMFGKLQLNYLLLTLKFPYLFFDLGIAVLLFKFFKESRNKLLAFGFWMFNPIVLYATYMMGQFDVAPTFLTLLALFFAVKKDKLFLAAFFLGLGASFKIFPFLFLIPLALVKDKWFDRIKIITIGMLTYFVTILPFINSPGFRLTALVANQTTKSAYAQLPISAGESILIFPFSVLFFYLIFLFFKAKIGDLWKRFFVITLLFFMFTHYHPQWLVWLTPFLVIDLVKSNLKHWLLVLIVFFSWLGLVGLFDPGLSVWLFSPITPNLYGKAGIWSGLGASFDLSLLKSYLQTMFVAVAGYYIYYYFPKKST